MIRVVGEIVSDRWAGRKTRRFLWKWPIGELVKFFLNLDAKVGVAIRPNATEDGVTFEQRAGETLGHQHPGRAEARHAGADNSNGVDVCEVHQVS